MIRLRDIAVRIEGAAPPGAAVGTAPLGGGPPGAGLLGALPDRSGGLGGGVAAILAELAARLERLAAAGDTALIDLRSLPMSPADRVELIDVLGQGEVTATLEANGESTLRETSYAGIWWILHRDRDGAVTAELLHDATERRDGARIVLDVGPRNACRK